MNAPDLDAMLNKEQCAEWFGINTRQLAAMNLPAFRPSHKVVRYHPRTIIAVLARRAGVPMDTIQASFGRPDNGKPVSG